MNPQDHDIAGNDPLTPEEQALARRLARQGGQAEPSPALDARILAAAHAASAEPSEQVPPMRRHSYRRARHRSARWPVLFAFVGSLALAFGIAWQLRPLPAPAPERAEVDDPALAAYKAPPPAMSARPVPPKPLNVPAPPPAEPRRAAPSRRAAIRPATPADAERKPQAFDDAHFMDEAVPMPAPPPEARVGVAPPPDAAPAAAAAEATAAPPVPMAQEAAPAAPSAPAAAKTANALQREADAAARAAHEARVRQEPAFAEPDEEVIPPATAESPAVRDAWIERIRELLRQGDADAARESLRAFRTRYPAHVLPEDLRALDE